ncbi:hypothetical protein [Endozoicomonas sp. ALC020]|uniref:hypothetical protein n=1 Tax=unclassified Endozoicomonas TaxID=2644528 RepID=UPI003BB13F13
MRRCITAPSEQYKLALAVSMVAMLELYGFLIYALMASYISGHFFPASDQLTSLLGSFAALAARFNQTVGRAVFRAPGTCILSCGHRHYQSDGGSGSLA